MFDAIPGQLSKQDKRFILASIEKMLLVASMEHLRNGLLMQVWRIIPLMSGLSNCLFLSMRI